MEITQVQRINLDILDQRIKEYLDKSNYLARQLTLIGQNDSMLVRGLSYILSRLPGLRYDIVNRLIVQYCETCNINKSFILFFHIMQEQIIHLDPTLPKIFTNFIKLVIHKYFNYIDWETINLVIASHQTYTGTPYKQQATRLIFNLLYKYDPEFYTELVMKGVLI